MSNDSRTYDYDTYKYYEGSDKDEITSGLRKDDSVRCCQYWIKGLSARCRYWEEETRRCSYDITNGKPSGYNFGKCDYLGRRFECNKYSAGEVEDLNQYWCILPNIFLSGVGKRVRDEEGNLTSDVTIHPIPIEDIKGYCEGRCDGFGRGTGCAEGSDPDTDPVVCNYYRPWQMGFGAEEPRPLEFQYIDGERIITPEAIEKAYDAVSTPMDIRLPFSFKVFNNRAYFQKCMHWNDNYGARFAMADDGSIKIYDQIGNEIDPSNYCTKNNPHARDYYELHSSPSSEWILRNVWSRANTVVCNGAKPECPCYTGRWVYCTDDKMLDGMRITANQIFELRFWARNWISQEEYDTYFKKRPNFLDVSTSDIFTFNKWLRLNPTDPSQSIMEGRRITMCMPAPIHKRFFVPEDYLRTEIIQYGAINIDEGTTAPEENQVYYPSLVRDIEVFEHQPLDVIYPYATNSPWSDEVCLSPDYGAGPYVKKGVSLDGDYISAVGSTIRDCPVYLVNLTNIEQPGDSSGPGLPSVYNMLLTNLNARELSEELPVITRSDVAEVNSSGLSEKDTFNMNVEFFLDYCLKHSPENIATSTSDSEGYFAINKVLLKYDTLNQIIVLVRFPDDEWDFRKIPVWSQLCGGALIQTHFEADDPNFAPSWLENGEIGGKIAMIGNNSKYGSRIYLDSIIPVTSNNYATLYNEYFEYSYCIKKVTLEDEEIVQWGRVGNTSCIWVEIEDTNVSHLFEWGIDSAVMTLSDSDDEGSEEETEGEEESISCDDMGEITLKQKDIEIWESGKLSIPPSACVLEPEDDEPVAFHNDTCKLEVTYWYKKFDNDITAGDNEEVAWPNFSQSNISFTEVSHNIEASDEEFTVSNVVKNTVALMAFFSDEGGRKVACMATKLIVWVPTLTCRNVEIYYKYSQPTIWYKLKPETSTSNLATPPTSEEFQGEYAPRIYKARCGDHENGNVCFNGPGIGPMWYPYTACDDRDFYKCFAGSNYCTNYYPETPRDDMRFCGPTVYTAWVKEGGAGAYADCVLYFHYRYSKTTGSPTFNGFANIVAWVDVNVYKAYCWDLPPFGNKGREMIEKWLSEENWPHLTYKDSLVPYVTREWVPIVPDKESFFLSFNAFEESSEITSENFKFTSQMNFMLSNLVSENVSVDSAGNADRKRFDEVFGLRGIYMATYPPPLIPYASAAKIAHYYFKESNAVWAWREFWKAIEYVSDRALFFVDYNRPEYIYAQDKNEHRYICEEAGHKITFKRPVIDKGRLVFFPGIQLGDGTMRYFEIRYDDYDESQIEWKDEDEGYVNASNESDGDGGGSIYQKTAPGEGSSQWSHDENILFDDEAVDNYEDAEIDGRVIDIIDELTGETTQIYYNRGLIASIKRSNLKHIPYYEISGGTGFDKENTDKAEDAVPDLYVPNLGLPADFIYIWYNISPTLDVSPPDVYADKEICISKIFIKGNWGIYKPSFNSVDLDYINANFGINLNERTYNLWDGYKICKPGISITIESLERPTEVVFSCQPVAYNEELHKNMGLAEYNFEIPVPPTVERMFYKPDHLIKVKFTCAANQFLILGSSSYRHNTASYTDSEELIYVYERKFFTSKGSDFEDYNLNGPKQGGNFPLQYELDMNNSGVYFPAHPHFRYVTDSPCEGKDKLRSVYADTQYREDESLNISLSNVENIEMNEQRELYDAAYNLNVDGDRLIYTIIIPPNIEKYLKDNNIELLSGANGQCVFTIGLNSWSDTSLYQSYKPGSGIWFPQGHKFMWGADVKKMFCYEKDYMPEYDTSGYGRFTIMDVSFIHMDYYELEISADPLSALYGNRMAFQLQVAQKTFGVDAGFADAGRIMGTASSFLDNSNVGL